ncbi:MAG: type II toxin-antitoxin system VapC family toxin [Spirochaetota bacterium]
MKLLLDTHAALWLVQGDARLSDRALTRIGGTNRDELFVSDMLLLELSMLIRKERIRVRSSTLDFVTRLAARFELAPVNPAIAVRAMELPLPQGDPFDRVFVATALELEAELVTLDAAITDSGLVPVVW